MKGACSVTRAAVAESEAGSGFGSWASRWRYHVSRIEYAGGAVRTYISLRTGSERFVAAAAAWEAFLFTIQLEEDNGLLDFTAAPNRFADIRRAIAQKLDARRRTKEGREEKREVDRGI
jgi:hypothetical protein